MSEQDLSAAPTRVSVDSLSISAQVPGAVRYWGVDQLARAADDVLKQEFYYGDQNFDEGAIVHPTSVSIDVTDDKGTSVFSNSVILSAKIAVDIVGGDLPAGTEALQVLIAPANDFVSELEQWTPPSSAYVDSQVVADLSKNVLKLGGDDVPADLNDSYGVITNHDLNVFMGRNTQEAVVKAFLLMSARAEVLYAPGQAQVMNSTSTRSTRIEASVPVSDDTTEFELHVMLDRSTSAVRGVWVNDLAGSGTLLQGSHVNWRGALQDLPEKLSLMITVNFLDANGDVLPAPRLFHTVLLLSFNQLLPMFYLRPESRNVLALSAPSAAGPGNMVSQEVFLSAREVELAGDKQTPLFMQFPEESDVGIAVALARATGAEYRVIFWPNEIFVRDGDYGIPEFRPANYDEVDEPIELNNYNSNPRHFQHESLSGDWIAEVVPAAHLLSYSENPAYGGIRGAAGTYVIELKNPPRALYVLSDDVVNWKPIAFLKLHTYGHYYKTVVPIGAERLVIAAPSEGGNNQPAYRIVTLRPADEVGRRKAFLKLVQALQNFRDRINSNRSILRSDDPDLAFHSLGSLSRNLFVSYVLAFGTVQSPWLISETEGDWDRVFAFCQAVFAPENNESDLSEIVGKAIQVSSYTRADALTFSSRKLLHESARQIFLGVYIEMTMSANDEFEFRMTPEQQRDNLLSIQADLVRSRELYDLLRATLSEFLVKNPVTNERPPVALFKTFGDDNANLFWSASLAFISKDLPFVGSWESVSTVISRILSEEVFGNIARSLDYRRPRLTVTKVREIVQIVQNETEAWSLQLPAPREGQTLVPYYQPEIVVVPSLAGSSSTEQVYIEFRDLQKDVEATYLVQVRKQSGEWVTFAMIPVTVVGPVDFNEFVPTGIDGEIRINVGPNTYDKDFYRDKQDQYMWRWRRVMRAEPQSPEEIARAVRAPRPADESDLVDVGEDTAVIIGSTNLSAGVYVLEAIHHGIGARKSRAFFLPEPFHPRPPTRLRRDRDPISGLLHRTWFSDDLQTFNDQPVPEPEEQEEEENEPGTVSDSAVDRHLVETWNWARSTEAAEAPPKPAKKQESWLPVSVAYVLVLTDVYPEQITHIVVRENRPFSLDASSFGAEGGFLHYKDLELVEWTPPLRDIPIQVSEIPNGIPIFATATFPGGSSRYYSGKYRLSVKGKEPKNTYDIPFQVEVAPLTKDADRMAMIRAIIADPASYPTSYMLMYDAMYLADMSKFMDNAGTIFAVVSSNYPTGILSLENAYVWDKERLARSNGPTVDIFEQRLVSRYAPVLVAYALGRIIGEISDEITSLDPDFRRDSHYPITRSLLDSVGWEYTPEDTFSANIDRAAVLLHFPSAIKAIIADVRNRIQIDGGDHTLRWLVAYDFRRHVEETSALYDELRPTGTDMTTQPIGHILDQLYVMGRHRIISTPLLFDDLKRTLGVTEQFLSDLSEFVLKQDGNPFDFHVPENFARDFVRDTARGLDPDQEAQMLQQFKEIYDAHSIPSHINHWLASHGMRKNVTSFAKLRVNSDLSKKRYPTASAIPLDDYPYHASIKDVETSYIRLLTNDADGDGGTAQKLLDDEVFVIYRRGDEELSTQTFSIDPLVDTASISIRPGYIIDVIGGKENASPIPNKPRTLSDLVDVGQQMNLITREIDRLADRIDIEPPFELEGDVTSLNKAITPEMTDASLKKVTQDIQAYTASITKADAAMTALPKHVEMLQRFAQAATAPTDAAKQLASAQAIYEASKRKFARKESDFLINGENARELVRAKTQKRIDEEVARSTNLKEEIEKILEDVNAPGTPEEKLKRIEEARPQIKDLNAEIAESQASISNIMSPVVPLPSGVSHQVQQLDKNQVDANEDLLKLERLRESITESDQDRIDREKYNKKASEDANDILDRAETEVEDSLRRLGDVVTDLDDLKADIDSWLQSEDPELIQRINGHQIPSIEQSLVDLNARKEDSENTVLGISTEDEDVADRKNIILNKPVKKLQSRLAESESVLAGLKNTVDTRTLDLLNEPLLQTARDAAQRATAGVTESKAHLTTASALIDAMAKGPITEDMKQELEDELKAASDLRTVITTDRTLLGSTIEKIKTNSTMANTEIAKVGLTDQKNTIVEEQAAIKKRLDELVLKQTQVLAPKPGAGFLGTITNLFRGKKNEVPEPEGPKSGPTQLSPRPSMRKEKCFRLYLGNMNTDSNVLAPITGADEGPARLFARAMQPYFSKHLPKDFPRPDTMKWPYSEKWDDVADMFVIDSKDATLLNVLATLPQDKLSDANIGSLYTLDTVELLNKKAKTNAPRILLELAGSVPVIVRPSDPDDRYEYLLRVLDTTNDLYPANSPSAITAAYKLLRQDPTTEYHFNVKEERAIAKALGEFKTAELDIIAKAKRANFQRFFRIVVQTTAEMKRNLSKTSSIGESIYDGIDKDLTTVCPIPENVGLTEAEVKSLFELDSKPGSDSTARKIADIYNPNILLGRKKEVARTLLKQSLDSPESVSDTLVSVARAVIIPQDHSIISAISTQRIKWMRKALGQDNDLELMVTKAQNDLDNDISPAIVSEEIVEALHGANSTDMSYMDVNSRTAYANYLASRIIKGIAEYADRMSSLLITYYEELNVNTSSTLWIAVANQIRAISLSGDQVREIVLKTSLREIIERQFNYVESWSENFNQLYTGVDAEVFLAVKSALRVKLSEIEHMRSLLSSSRFKFLAQVPRKVSDAAIEEINAEFGDIPRVAEAYRERLSFAYDADGTSLIYPKLVEAREALRNQIAHKWDSVVFLAKDSHDPEAITALASDLDDASNYWSALLRTMCNEAWKYNIVMDPLEETLSWQFVCTEDCDERSDLTDIRLAYFKNLVASSLRNAFVDSKNAAQFQTRLKAAATYQLNDPSVSKRITVQQKSQIELNGVEVARIALNLRKVYDPILDGKSVAEWRASSKVGEPIGMLPSWFGRDFDSSEKFMSDLEEEYELNREAISTLVAAHTKAVKEFYARTQL